MNERVQRLEEKIAYLERHVTEQDKVILEFGDLLAKLRLELRALRERSPETPGGANPPEAEDERPPHY
jgi:SlyX protein